MYPLTIDIFKYIGQLILFRNSGMQGNDIKGDVSLLISQNQFVCLCNGLIKNMGVMIRFSSINFLVIDFKFGKNYLRRYRIFTNVIRIENGETIYPPP